MQDTSKSSGAMLLTKTFMLCLLSAGVLAVSSYMLFKFFTALGETMSNSFEFWLARAAPTRPSSRSAREESRSPAYTAATAALIFTVASASLFDKASAKLAFASGNLKLVSK